MDPLSIIASIAGIASTGTALSKAIYEFISSTRGASREMVEIARNIADLSIILGELRRVLREGAELCNRKYLRRIKSAMGRISRIHNEIRQLMNDAKGMKGLKWGFKRSGVQHKLVQIESHKTGINLMLNVLVLAITTRKHLEPKAHIGNGKDAASNKAKDDEEDVHLLREQSENLACAAYQSLASLSESQIQEPDIDLEQPNNTSSSQNSENHAQLQVQAFRNSSDDTATWLFDLVFSTYTQSCMDPSLQDSSDSSSDSSGSDTDEEAAQARTRRKNKRNTGHNVVIRDPLEMQIAIYNPGTASSLVKELLADWTVLTEKEIGSITSERRSSNNNEAEASESSQKGEELIFFKDAVGRKFKFPFYRVQKYEGMKKLVESAFNHVDVLGPHVIEGHFDLLGPDGDVILPDVWGDIIEAGMSIEMKMWPMEAPTGRPPRGNPFGPNMPMGNPPMPPEPPGSSTRHRTRTATHLPPPPPPPMTRPMSRPADPEDLARLLRTPKPPREPNQPQEAARRSPENAFSGGSNTKKSAGKKKYTPFV